MKPIVIPAEAGGTCALCGRTHRKLMQTRDGWLMGQTCHKNYEEITIWVAMCSPAARAINEPRFRDPRTGPGDKIVDKVLALHANR